MTTINSAGGRSLKLALAILGFSAGFVVEASDFAEISNFRSYSDTFASSGQPSEADMNALRSAGFQRIVYIAWTDHENSLPHEDRVVRSLGMEYVHIPVDWMAPTASDFYLFAGAMQRAPERKTLLHCQVNYRASAFSFLYRVIYERVPVAEAKRDLNSVWLPNETWRDLIFEILRDNGISPHCDGCDWTPPPEPAT
ncbi:MAG: protein tyrosine phosphatase family protein [Woeseia sp.]|nr:protein tyrosine phosphatase family protein [Woeseia sp.]